jgi:hypothetical protein
MVKLISDRVQLRDIRWTGRTCVREAEASPLLKAVARKRLLKILQAVKGLLGGVAICKVCKLAVAL